MPVLEMNTSRSGRYRIFLRAQFPLLLGTAFVTAEGIWALPAVVMSSYALVGLAVILLASGLFLALPWERWPNSRLIILAGLDVIGVAFLRLGYYDDLRSVGILSVFPVVWLAYGFRRRVIVLAVAGAFFITLLPLAVEGLLPRTRLEIASVVTLPVLITGLAIAVGEAARQLSASQRRTQKALHELQESLSQAEDSDRLTRTLFGAVDVAMVFYDTEEQVVLSNSLAERAVAAAGFRLDQPPYAGADVRSADNKTPVPFEQQIIPRALRGDLDNHEMEWIGPIGQQIAVTATWQRVQRSDGSPWGTLVAAHDVTALARSIQVKDDFVATVSHELRTPLTSILGYLEVLTDEIAPPEGFVADTLETIRRSALKLQDRIGDLLDTADRHRTLDLEPTDLARLLEGTLEQFRKAARAADVVLGVEATPPAWATVDRALIEQAFENVVSNAIKYTDSGGHVTISLTRTESQVLVTVVDDGIGMTPDEVSRAFDTFWRSDTARHRAIQGIGIGLGLVRNIITAHRGTIEIISTPGRGTTVHVAIPLHP